MPAHVYRPAWWIPGAHLRTLGGKFMRSRDPGATRVERWETDDDDFLDIHRLDAPPGAPRLLILHGLEGSIRSHYAGGLLREAQRRGWAADLLIFRSCGDEPNRALRFYHSGETTDLDFVVRRLIAEDPARPLLMIGVSLGGNVVLKWLGEQGENAPEQLVGAAAVSVPFDLARGSRFLDRGFSRLYQAHFLRSLRRKAIGKSTRYPDALRPEVVGKASTLYEFDDLVTAPVHGFRDANDYYTRSSSLHYLARIRTPTLLLSAHDDPFLPRDVLDAVRTIADANSCLDVEFVEQGGHVGFISGSVPWRPFYYAEWRATEFLSAKVLSYSLGSPSTSP
ncbi:MAG: hydrolase [Gemmatimonadota bacterium]|nr:hydrolase [Gemmatimonadota bacterium]